jgi:hypothetical protein
MPASALALVGLFIVVAVVSGIAAVRAVGPWRPAALALPIVVSFLALYLVGHRLGAVVGPQVSVLGFEVSLLFDVAIALVAAFLAAFAQRAFLRRGAGRTLRT